MSHTIELVPGVAGLDGLRIDGTLHSAAEVVAALRERHAATRVTRAALLAIAIADARRTVRSAMPAFAADDPTARRLLGHLDDAEAQAWAALAEAVGGDADGPRATRR
jgi:hypothetical protein